MMSSWVCEVCLVPNDDVPSCVCCATPRPRNKDHANLKQDEAAKDYAVGTVNDASNGQGKDVHTKDKRLRMDFDSSALPHSCLFVVGSSEVDQLPKHICDKSVNEKDGSTESLFECSLPTPLVEKGIGAIAHLACGSLHTAVVTRKGRVYTFGCNDMGALGREENSNVPECNPYPVRLRRSIKKVSCGDNHTLFLTDGGTVYFTGAFRDTSGVIGIPDFTDMSSLKNKGHLTTPIDLPLSVSGSTVINDICSGENHCLLLPTSGVGIYVMGSNEFGQLMLPKGYEAIVPTEKQPDLSDENLIKLALTWPQFLVVEQLFTSKRNPTRGVKRRKHGDEYIRRIFTGYCTSFIETGISRRIYGAGRNAQGEVGCESDELCIMQPTELVYFHGIRISKIVGGQFFTAALTDDGNLFTWGNCSYIGRSIQNEHDTQKSPKKLIFFKDNVTELFVGADACFAVTKRRQLFAWGSAQNYVLGNGRDYTFQVLPELINSDHFPGYNVIGGMGGSQHTVFLCNKAKNTT
ncbi:Regulator of chromosome condensation (RCC1) repeat family protein [Babesia bovis T2Bo]|uniref:Regulator of chromosome condensation (RCC1) domain containing protein n=1 Tax=Babesia bovis TaxID=5865 RepID=A7AME6_BABBO|nr:Regulator of chromosome condensation (RCC1) repeat family protein [Babesia bovis T2Bo]EDO07730.1 Regulator of chromosome condensation (RCC1) repeat family protein [Babesia bovis T2Bo]|eukprot:XP_001611298.1 regulator of chromosome condensation (RCC1) domain containing protein [Babesia bovis T2Bo]